MASPEGFPKVISNTQPSVRISRLKAFLPLSEEATYSTRGQKLPNIIRNRSSVNVSEIQKRDSLFRKPSVLAKKADHDLEDGSYDDEEHGQIIPPPDFPLPKPGEDRRPSSAAAVLNTPQMRSQRLIGNSNPRYEWKQYFKTEEELKQMNKPLRRYYERNNYLIQQYEYIDRLLDSSLPHDLIQEYGTGDTQVDVPETIPEESNTTGGEDSASSSPPGTSNGYTNGITNGKSKLSIKVKRTPRDLYRVTEDENTPLLNLDDNEAMAAFLPEADGGDDVRIVTVAIYLNMAANTILLILKIIVTILTDSLSVLASLVDAALDFLSTAIVWTTTTMISRSDADIQNFPVGRRRLEPIGVLVFSVIMITSFFQVALQAIQVLAGPKHEVVALTTPAVAIMASTVVIKFACWLWCRLIRNSSVQALAQDAMTDVVFNIFSIIFPLVGYFGRIWWLDPLGGLVLSLYVIVAWSLTTRTHIQNLTGRAASADERNILLYLTMRFAHTIKHIQGLTAYHAGDKLNVEVDIVLDSDMSLQDSHDLGESLQYVLESVPGVERAFVHADYKKLNLPSHMRQ